ncbi:MAG: GWxTD domain-containing protein [Flavobacteriales bacterium]
MNLNVARFWVGLMLVAATGCSISSLQTPSQRRPYDREASSLHPEITLHRKVANTEVDVYFRVPREELLYSRMDGSSPFVAQIQVQVGDTMWHLLDTAWADSPRMLTQQWNYRSGPLRAWEDVTVTDVLRNAAVTARKAVGPEDRWGSTDVLIWSQAQDWPLSGEHAQTGDTLLLHLPHQLAVTATQPVVWDMSNAAAPTNLPPPPYSSARLRWDTLQPTPLGALEADSLIVLVVPDGTTLLQWQGSGLALRFHGTSGNFPSVVSPNELIAPLRYIASRSEFHRLQSAEHPKIALDEFWLACNPSSEAARSLLNTYYDRVEEANLAFSGLVEGWRTDRGMIHVVFGVPQRVRRDAWNEYWIYGEEGTANALTFHFRRRSNLLDDNYFELQRSIQFRSVWDRGISNWRNGRVRGD